MSELTPLLVFSIFVSVLGMFQFGYSTGVINIPQKPIENWINDTLITRYSAGVVFQKSMISLIFSVVVSLFLIGGMMGGLLSGWLANRFGRQRSLLGTQALGIISGIAMATSKALSSIEMLILGRFLNGIACGLYTGLVPLYINEISPIGFRGRLGTINQLAVTSGIFVSQILGLPNLLGDNWPFLLGVSLIPSLLQTLLLPFLPESPIYLISKNRADEAYTLLKKFGHIECNQNSPSCDDRPEKTLSVLQLFGSTELRSTLLITIAMHLSQQITGIIAIMYYSTDIFINAQVPTNSAKYATLGVGAIVVFMTIVSIPLMDKLGRRPLHLTGLGGMFVATVMILIAFNVGDYSWVSISLVFSTLLFVVFFALGPGSIPWLITGEIFTPGPRPAAVTVATVVNWFANFGVGFLFPILHQNLGTYSFAPFCFIIAILFIYLFMKMPETKNKSSNEIAAFVLSFK